MSTPQPAFPTFTHTDGQEYFAFTRQYKYLPKITGMPEISINKFRKTKVGHIRDKYGRKIVLRKKVRTPKSCRYYRVMNHNWRKLGAPQMAIIGNVGTGKTTLANLNTAILRAKGKRIIYFVDRRMEVRSLAWHGYWKGAVFHPFKLIIFIPDGYSFLIGNHLWYARPKNVFLRYYQTLAEVIDAAAEPDTIVCLYDEAYDPISRINLLEAVGQEISKRNDTVHHYLIVHNELETILEECVSKESNKPVRALARAFVAYRKDQIGLMCCFHMPEEVFFKITRKFNIVFYKQPTLKRNMNLAEEDAIRFALNQVNISQGGRFCKHEIDIFPEVVTQYRSIPAEKSLKYESVITSENEDTEVEDLDQDISEALLAYEKATGHTDTETAEVFGYSQQYISKKVKPARDREFLAKIRQKTLITT